MESDKFPHNCSAEITFGGEGRSIVNWDYSSEGSVDVQFFS